MRRGSCAVVSRPGYSSPHPQWELTCGSFSRSSCSACRLAQQGATAFFWQQLRIADGDFAAQQHVPARRSAGEHWHPKDRSHVERDDIGKGSPNVLPANIISKLSETSR
ncbi:MAG: hypothetical protein R3C02_14565 [Planctomycetaceae bacterium]